jgi:subtilisin-like proprotein convertase family protein
VSKSFLSKALRSFLLVQVFILLLLYFAFPVLTNTQVIEEIIIPNTNSLTFTNPNPITINDNAAASPYPSTINVTNAGSRIAKVIVKLNGFGHTFPSDVDVLLVGPGGQTAVIMSDVGSSFDITGVTLTLDDAATTSMPTAATLTTGTFLPTNSGTGDAFPAPAPASSSSSTLSVFNNTNPNGIWRLYVVDDATVDTGSFAGGWSLTIVKAISGENTNAISIPDNGIASPYPSDLQVSGLPGKVTSVIVNLTNFSHSSPDDVDLLLVSPSGRSAVIMSDVGGGNPVSNITLTLDDNAASSLPDSGALTAGTFKPTDFEPGETFPSPAPSGTPTGTKLAAFFNDEPNGTWKLFAVDDSGGSAGSITGGWSILLNTSTTALGIPPVGTSEPYPSGITISGQIGLVSKVTINLQNFSHTSPDDVDLMLAAPNGRKIILMSDVGGATEVNNLSLTFDDAASVTLPDNTPLASGSFRPTDFEPGDTFPAPAPSGAITGAKLSVFNGSDPNGVWQLFLVDDNGNNAGSIDGWNISLQTSQTAITIPANGTAEPYPADKSITGLQGNVIKAVVKLTNFSHTSPDDVDIMLVAPNGRRIVLMSDVGGSAEAGSLDLTFDDAAASGLPDNSSLSSGTFKPTDFEQGDIFPAPAPQGAPTGTTLNAFYGSAPNGVWKLFVVDDNGENLGSIAGSWNLTLTTSTSACVFTISPFGQSFPITGGSGNFGINMPTGCSWTASTISDFITIDSPAAGDGNGAISYSVAPNMGGGRGGSIDVSNGVLVRNYQIQQPSGCPFSLAQTEIGVGAAGGSRSVNVTAGGICSWQATSSANWVQITSPQQTGNGAVTFNVQPNPNPGSRSASVTVGARTFTVNQAGASARRFDFDGDGSSDISVYRPSTGIWYLLNSASPGSYSAIQFGLETDRVAPADFDGDRKADVTVYRNGVWFIFQSQTNTVRIESWGLASDTVVPGDYDGDGRADLAVYRPGDGTWYVRRSTDGVYQTTVFGNSEDRPVPADYDGDGKLDLAHYHPGNVVSSWAILSSANGQTTEQQFGNAGDIAVPGDFDGDGRDNLVVFRPANGTWYTSLDPATNYGAKRWGIAGDIPAAGDYNGDGRADFAIYRQGVWYILYSNDETTLAYTWGLASDTVVPAAFNAQ